MVLQELAVAKEWILPEYTIIHAKEGTHDNIFHHQVVLNGEVAIGVGRSKKEAKHRAASLLLDKLSEVVDGNLPQASTPERKLKLVNAVGNLGDICLENKIPMPIFTQISDVGPPHCREFTYECQVAALVTRATSSTKKQAKHWAAKEMTDRIMNVLPELINEYEEQQLVSTALNEQVKEAYNRVKSERPKPNLSLQIEDRYLHLKHIAIEKGVDNSCVETYTLEPSMDNLKILLEKMELSYYMQTLQDRAGCNIIALSLNTDVPFSVLGMGSNSETALQDALITCFENLRILLLDIE